MVQLIGHQLIGQEIGQYRIIGKIGQGGVATIYRAQQLNIERDVAIKVLTVNDPDFIQSLEREAKTIARLSHPHILKLFDFGSYGGTSFLVMELITGGSLAQIIRGGPLPLEVASSFLDQLASALDYAHREGIVHRDLKPHNVLIDGNGNVLLSDFGLARLTYMNPESTPASVVIGTPYYMAPEQWQGGPVDARTDIYALGIIAFEMLTGKVPFRAETPFQLMQMHTSQMPPHLQEFDSELPRSLDAIVQQALRKDPAERFASAGQMATAFHNAVVELTQTVYVEGEKEPEVSSNVRPDATLRLPKFVLHQRLTRRQLVSIFAVILAVLCIALLIPEFSLTSKANHDPLWPLAVDTLPGLTSEQFAEAVVRPTITPTMTATPSITPTVAPTITPTPLATTPKYASSSDDPSGIIPPAMCIAGRNSRRC